MLQKHFKSVAFNFLIMYGEVVGYILTEADKNEILGLCEDRPRLCKIARLISEGYDQKHKGTLRIYLNERMGMSTTSLDNQIDSLKDAGIIRLSYKTGDRTGKRTRIYKIENQAKFQKLMEDIAKLEQAGQETL